MSLAPLTPDEEDEALAGAYVLGVLDLDERLAVERRLPAAPALAAAIAAWETRLSPLNDAYAEAPLPDGMLARIEARLFPAPAPRRGWRWMGWGAGVLSAALLALAVLVWLPPPPAAELLAVLGTPATGLVYEAHHDGARLRVDRVAGAPAPQGQVHELWLLAPEAAPVALGLLDREPLVIDYPRPPAGWVLAVSVEPEGGAPQGLPTGPVILQAAITP